MSLPSLNKVITYLLNKVITDDAGGLDDTSPDSSIFIRELLHEQAVRVHQVKGSTAQT